MMVAGPNGPRPGHQDGGPRYVGGVIRRNQFVGVGIRYKTRTAGRLWWPRGRRIIFRGVKTVVFQTLVVSLFGRTHALSQLDDIGPMPSVAIIHIHKETSGAECG